MGGTIACAMELYQRGYLTEKQAGGPVNWEMERSWSS